MSVYSCCVGRPVTGVVFMIGVCARMRTSARTASCVSSTWAAMRPASDSTSANGSRVTPSARSSTTSLNRDMCTPACVGSRSTKRSSEA